MPIIIFIVLFQKPSQAYILLEIVYTDRFVDSIILAWSRENVKTVHDKSVGM